jgi:acylphosphatase
MELHVLVRGRVQGVGFRWFVREVARDRADGTVEVAAAGEPQMLERLRDMLRAGPTGASVSAVDDVRDPLREERGDLSRPFTILR